MQRNAYRWDHVLIELEIDGIILESRMITYGAYQRVYKLFKTRATSQPKEWAIYVRYQRNFKTVRNTKLFDLLNCDCYSYI